MKIDPPTYFDIYTFNKMLEVITSTYTKYPMFDTNVYELDRYELFFRKLKIIKEKESESDYTLRERKITLKGMWIKFILKNNPNFKKKQIIKLLKVTCER